MPRPPRRSRRRPAHDWPAAEGSRVPGAARRRRSAGVVQRMGRRLDNLRRIVAAVAALPVTIDLESGYGDAPDAVAATVAAAIQAGAIGCNLEDSYPADG